MKLEVNDAIILEQRQAIEAALTSNPSTERRLRSIIAKALQQALRAVQQSARGSLGSDPRHACEAVRRSVYRQVLGGNLNILSPRRASGGGATWRGSTRKLDTNPHQRGGNRRPRSARTEQVDGYFGKDRGFVLRFVNSGTSERDTRYGRRGSIGARNWFPAAGTREMQRAADVIAQTIDQELVKIMSGQ